MTVARHLGHGLLGRGSGGEIVVREDGRSTTLGRQDERPALRAEVEIHDPRAWRGLLRGSAGMGESYADGHWDADDLVALIRIAARNASRFDATRRRFHVALRPLQRLRELPWRNTLRGSRRNISAHYDLGNDLFAAFLDDTMMYSCAVYEHPRASLHEAQIAKLDRICAKLGLEPGMHLLEIGSGWGALAIHAAAEYGARVTATTISREQHALATERVRRAGVADRVDVLLADYRELTGSYDRLVSIEMIEAVGWQYFDTYFAKVAGLLADDGLALIQAITIDDRAYEVEKASNSFIKRTIFPGGCLPSVEVMQRCVKRTDMRTVGLEDITPHYVRTLRDWRERFLASAHRLDGERYDARFRRLWELYLAYCEAGFAERRIQDVQLMVAKPRFAGEAAIAVARPGDAVAQAA